MASSSVLVGKPGLPPTTVQELLKSNNNNVTKIPDIYKLNKNVDASVDLPYMDPHIIDLEPLLDLSSPLAQHELAKLRASYTTWGCFQLVNHGVACSLMDRLHSVGKEFFALPIEEKKKYSRTLECFEGYGSDLASPDGPISWNDRLYLKIHPPEQRNLKLWPENVPNFRETLDEYSRGMWKVLETMLKAIAKSINLDEKAFLNQYGEDGSFLARFNYYPPCPYPDQVLGLGPHSDGTLITMLLQDNDCEGLQILRDEQWYKVPVIPGALCINIGDQLEILNNGILKSPIHKAVTNTEKARLSVSVPTSVHDNKEIGPLRELIDEGRPRLYKNVDNYLGSLFQTYARGVRPLDAAKIQQ